MGSGYSRTKALSLWAKLKGLLELSTPTFCPLPQITAFSPGAPGQMVLMNATDTWNAFGGQCSPAFYLDTPRCLPSLPSPNSKPTFEHWPQKQSRSQSKQHRQASPSARSEPPPHLGPSHQGSPLPPAGQETVTCVTNKLPQGRGDTGSCWWGKGS